MVSTLDEAKTGLAGIGIAECGRNEKVSTLNDEKIVSTQGEPKISLTECGTEKGGVECGNLQETQYECGNVATGSLEVNRCEDFKETEKLKKVTECGNQKIKKITRIENRKLEIKKGEGTGNAENFLLLLGKSEPKIEKKEDFH